MISVFNESFTLGDTHGVQELALCDLTVSTEELIESIFSSIEGKSLNEKFELTIVLIRHSGSTSLLLSIGS